MDWTKGAHDSPAAGRSKSTAPLTLLRTVWFSPVSHGWPAHVCFLLLAAISAGSCGVESSTPTSPSRGPSTSFGPGQYRVGTDIAPGRYFGATTGTGCYWERQSGFGGSFDEIITNEFVAFAANQMIVDIAVSDRGFKTTAPCGTWNQTPRAAPAPGTVTAGWWLVNSQIQPGRYSTTASPRCEWRRLRDFSGVYPNDNIEVHYLFGGGPAIVQIEASDVGFYSDPACGTWRP